jgi:FkbM family methyltransferase
MHLGWAAYHLYTKLNLKWRACVSIDGRPIYVRSNTQDLSVAYSSFRGEFDAAIEAAKPLKHNFIIDAGGYIGTSSIMFAEAFPAATVVVLEPSKVNFALLVRNTRSQPNILPINAALGPTQARAMLRDRGTGEWGYSIVRAPQDCVVAPALHDVEIITIPQILSSHGVGGIDLLKLDIEGAELSLLRVNTAWLRYTRVIFAELHDRIAPGCSEAFAALDRTLIACNGEKILSLARS